MDTVLRSWQRDVGARIIADVRACLDSLSGLSDSPGSSRECPGIHPSVYPRCICAPKKVGRNGPTRTGRRPNKKPLQGGEVSRRWLLGLSRIVPVAGLALAPWGRHQVAGRVVGPDPSARSRFRQPGRGRVGPARQRSHRMTPVRWSARGHPGAVPGGSVRINIRDALHRSASRARLTLVSHETAQSPIAALVFFLRTTTVVTAERCSNALVSGGRGSPGARRPAD